LAFFTDNTSTTRKYDMAKSEKQVPQEETAAKPKGKKVLLIIVGLLVLAAAAAAGWYFMGSHSEPKNDKAKETVLLDQPKFVALEPFTVNLQREEGDQFLQVGISLKIFDPTLEEKIKAQMPEIRSRLLLLLSSKHASELTPVEGKKKLADEIITAVDGVLGIQRPVRKVIKLAAASAVAAASDVAEASTVAAPETEAPAAAQPTDENAAKEGIVDVLFTSFIIQ
jgi:flagellar FliL protein